jgi:hypothetical protein
VNEDAFRLDIEAENKARMTALDRDSLVNGHTLSKEPSLPPARVRAQVAGRSRQKNRKSQPPG